MNRLRITLPVALLALTLSGCAIGNSYDYRTAQGQIASAEQKTVISVAAVDRRQYLIDGEVSERYVGMTRGGYGNPFRVHTKSASPFSEDLAEAVAASLNTAGYRAQANTGFPVMNQAEAFSRLLATPASRFVLVTINQWESDTLTNTELNLNVTLSVSDKTGKVLASENYEASRDLGGNIMNPVLHARKGVILETSKILGSLLSSPKIVAALR